MFTTIDSIDHQQPRYLTQAFLTAQVFLSTYLFALAVSEFVAKRKNNKREPIRRLVITIGFVLCGFGACLNYDRLFSKQYNNIVIDNGLLEDCGVTRILCGDEKVAAYDPKSPDHFPSDTRAEIRTSDFCKNDKFIKLDMRCGNIDTRITFNGTETSVSTDDALTAPPFTLENPIIYSGKFFVTLKENKEKNAKQYVAPKLIK